MEVARRNEDVSYVFIPGLTGSRNNIQKLKRHLPGIRSFDLPGFGKKKKPEIVYDTPLFMACLEDEILEPCVLVGHSMGAILAKEFALRHPELVKRLFLINYPLNSPAGIERAVRKNRFLSMYIDGRILARWVCNTKVMYKFFLIPFGLVRFRGYLRSFWDGFYHTYTSCSSALGEVVLKEDWRTLLPLREKTVLITGAEDDYTDPSLLELFCSYRLAGMGHRFFWHETEIATIIRSTMAKPVPTSQIGERVGY